jgi:hypothetical protein
MRDYPQVIQGASSRSMRCAEHPAPGKQTQVMALSTGAPVQCKSEPIQRTGSAEPPPPNPVYQYGPETTHDNDCGPASVLMMLRLMNLESNLRGWIVAHRPVQGLSADPAYQRVYPGALPGMVDPQEELDVARACAGIGAERMRDDGYRLQAPITGEDGVVKITDLREALVCLLRVIGAQLPENVDDFLPLATEGEDGIGDIDVRLPENERALLRYLYRHCANDQAIIVLGAPEAWHQDANDQWAVTSPWGWGGDSPTAGGRTVPIDPGGGHFVVVYSFNRGTRLFTVLDPSFARPRRVSSDQLVEFITNRGGSLANMMTVPLDTVRSWMPATQLKRGAPAMSTAPDAPGGSGAPLPPGTQARMERSFGADFASVRVHEDAAAARLGALGYAQGNDLHFAPGQYRPGTPSGDALLGHELAHVVQQREGRVAAPQSKGAVVEDPALEASADREGERAAAGQPAREPSTARLAQLRVREGLV